MLVRKIKTDNLRDAVEIIAKTKCDEYVHKKLAKKMLQGSFIVDGIDNRGANILKQEALSCGCDAAVSKDVSMFEKGISSVVICATEYQSEKLILKLKEQPFGLKNLAEKLIELNSTKEQKYIVCANRKISLKNKPLVMGIVNLSEDSFFGNGISDISKAVETAEQMQRDGADIIDVGAESTRPGSTPVNVKDEISKITKFLKLAAKKIKILISIDTYKPEAAEAALSEGADIINDIYALRYPIEDCKQRTTNKMAEVIAKHKAAAVLMHMLKNPLTMQQNIKYNDTLSDICEFLAERADFAVECGIKKEAIIIDPGIGFGKTVEDNLLIIKRLAEFKSLGYPVLAGISNKSFIAKVIENEDLKERFSANITANILAAANGADILRVHNVKEIKQSLKLFNAVAKVQAEAAKI